jgi:hypothetical protein
MMTLAFGFSRFRVFTKKFLRIKWIRAIFDADQFKEFRKSKKIFLLRNYEPQEIPDKLLAFPEEIPFFLKSSPNQVVRSNF